MSERLAGKVALVTGAGSSGPGWGNGKATAVLFAREGARVCLIPMAISITFGLALATVWILYLVPTLYLVYGRLSGRGRRETATG